MSPLEENFVILVEQFSVLPCFFEKICRNQRMGHNLLIPDTSLPCCFSFPLLASLCPQVEAFGKALYLFCGLCSFKQHVSGGFQRLNLFLYLKLRTAVPGASCQDWALVSLGVCQVTSSARVSLHRSRLADT